jgi:hypothetical protein
MGQLLGQLPRRKSMAEGEDPKLALFELYLATAEKVSDRRAQASLSMHPSRPRQGVRAAGRSVQRRAPHAECSRTHSGTPG